MQTINHVSKQTIIQTNKHTNKQASSEKHVHMPMARGVGITKKKRDSLSFWLKAENITNLRTALRPDSPIYCHAEANVRMQVQPFWIEVLVLPTILITILYLLTFAVKQLVFTAKTPHWPLALSPRSMAMGWLATAPSRGNGRSPSTVEQIHCME